MTDRIEALEAQVNALAQEWLRLGAALEVAGAVAPASLERASCSVRWPDQPFEHEAIKTLGWLCDPLAQARKKRRSTPTLT